MGAIPPSSVPVIDLSELTGAHYDRVVESIIHACQGYGVFQVVNHGMPVEFLEELKEMGYRFFNQPEEKMAIYTATGAEHPPVTYEKGTANDPVNVLFLTGNSEEYARKYWPDICKEVAIKYQNSAGELVERILRILLNDLGVTLDQSLIDLYMAERDVLFNHYPAFPNENLEISAKRKHTDPYTLTVILQDHVGGLFAKVDEGEWVQVQPIPDALIIIVGDSLEVISNGKYKAGAHYVQTTGKETRISIPLFVHRIPTARARPHPLAVQSDGGEPRYKEFIYKDLYTYTYTYYKSQNEMKPLGRFKISSN